jgi:hypothetical protein
MMMTTITMTVMMIMIIMREVKMITMAMVVCRPASSLRAGAGGV